MKRDPTLRPGVLLVILLAIATNASAAEQPLPVALVSITSPVSHGRPATIAVKTAPAVECRIIVTYRSGPSRAKGLTPKTSDGHGMVSWTWIVGTRTTPGTWPISVSCSAGGRPGTLQTSIVVQ